MNDSTWTWISGNTSYYAEGIYGEIGKPSTENMPGARRGALVGYDNTRQELWLFGGSDFNNGTRFSYFYNL